MKHAYIDEHSEIQSLIHHLDPRIKIVSFISLILCIIFTKPIAFPTFALYAILIGILILLSKIPITYILKRSFVIIPFVLVISIFLPFIKGGEIAGGFSLGSLKLNVTYAGLLIFWNVLIKAYLSILCLILLTSSTKFSDLLKAFERLKVPRLIVMILSFMYRYIFVIEDEFMKMKLAKESRSVGGSHWMHAKALANMVGVLFIRSYERAESVYLAMCSRGFHGDIRTLHDFRLVAKDYVFVSSLIASLIAIRLIGM